MMRLERRDAPSVLALWLGPVFAVCATLAAAALLFVLLGKDPRAVWDLMIAAPLSDPYMRSEILVKAAPLALIALGLALGFRANVWNIGAEGQFVIGALAGGAVGLAFYDIPGLWLLPLMALAGMAGGLLWAMIPALLRTRFGTSEILVSLMLVYVAELLLVAMVSGPLKDPEGYGFPQGRLFHDSATLPLLLEGGRITVAVPLALGGAVALFILLRWHLLGFHVQVSGAAPRAARFAGVSANRIVVICLGLSGALAGLAGLFEAAGPVGQLVPSLAQGYGFTAIIVAFLGRLHPVGILLAALVMALSYIGGENAQIGIGLPAAAIAVFQGMLLLFLLAADIFVTHRRAKRGAR